MSLKVLITDDVDPLLIRGLKKLGYDCEYNPEISLSEVRHIVGDYVGIVINSKIKVDPSFLAMATKLKFIARLGSGLDIIDLPEAKKRNVHVISAPEGNCNAVAEHALGMLLALLNNLNRADQQVRNFIWKRELNRGHELSGKTIAVVGYGHTGKKFVEKLEGMEVKVLVYDKYLADFARESEYIEEISYERIFEADIISFHLPLTEETFHYCNEDFIANCRKGVILINTSRGNVIKLEDLLQGLYSGQVGGVCMDVFENEKPQTYSDTEQELYSNLFSHDYAIFSPHVAGWTVQSKVKIAQTLLDKISREM